ncbi:LacI family DNA-binding transcriptional regulator [Clostridium saccharobutylicum]|uniref:Putative HTH-type transcriptional repressor ExuR n=1 Tax=Clostridium saccharobutylicum TaxID=169679 RepID=A0A1S8MTI7_CLOSA|nr:LacI family DNA-binding transcriptional regulator [Clostridium saccharobutylicum]OOM07483.1 putative HTH-type transcriptional repressor ExuR [Clostridium saccharobutylicum]
MATMKDVAKLAGVSVSTVSIVINGKAKERNIPLTTYNKVNEAIEELGYQPNVSARRLRNLDSTKPIIALYWPLDARTNMLAALLTGIQIELNKIQFDCELVIQTYTNDKIENNSKEIANNTYNGVIIGASSQGDIDYLESLSPRMPVILINRKSNKFSTVSVNSNDVATEAVSLLSKNSIKQVGIIKAENPYVASSQRIQAFLSACKQNNISVDTEHIITASNSFIGGIEAVNKYISIANKPKIIFCESDLIVLGMIYEFNRLNIKIPDDVSIISIGTIGSDFTKYSTPSITTIDIPPEKIAGGAISILVESLSKTNVSERLTPIHKKIKPEKYLRESFQ